MVKATLKERSEHFIKRARDKFGDKFIYDKVEYLDSFTLVRIFCTIHKDYFTTTPKNFLSTLVPTCPKCKFSFDRSTWDHQKVLDNVSYSGLTGYPSFTEYFNGYSWIPISEYKKGTSVAVFEPLTQTVTLEKPKLIKTKNVDMVIFSTVSNKTVHKPFSFVTGKEGKLLVSRHGSYTTTYVLTKITREQKVYLPLTFKTEEIPLTIDDNLFKLLIHIYLSDSFLFKLAHGKTNLKITKLRQFEVERLSYLLDINNIEYNIKTIKASNKHNFKHVFNISFKGLKNINIPFNWYNLSTYYKNLIITEIFNYFDIVKKSNKDSCKYYKCPNKHIFDFLQFTLHSLGSRANFYISEDSSGIEYYYIAKTSFGDRTLTKTQIEDFNYNGLAYGFKTRTGFCLFRQNNNIFIAPDGFYEIK